MIGKIHESFDSDIQHVPIKQELDRIRVTHSVVQVFKESDEDYLFYPAKKDSELLWVSELGTQIDEETFIQLLDGEVYEWGNVGWREATTQHIADREPKHVILEHLRWLLPTKEFNDIKEFPYEWLNAAYPDAIRFGANGDAIKKFGKQFQHALKTRDPKLEEVAAEYATMTKMLDSVYKRILLTSLNESPLKFFLKFGKGVPSDHYVFISWWLTYQLTSMFKNNDVDKYMGILIAAIALYARPMVDRKRGLFTSKDYRAVTAPWVRAYGPLHPEDRGDGH